MPKKCTIRVASRGNFQVGFSVLLPESRKKVHTRKSRSQIGAFFRSLVRFSSLNVAWNSPEWYLQSRQPGSYCVSEHSEWVAGGWSLTFVLAQRESHWSLATQTCLFILSTYKYSSLEPGFYRKIQVANPGGKSRWEIQVGNPGRKSRSQNPGRLSPIKNQQKVVFRSLFSGCYHAFLRCFLGFWPILLFGSPRIRVVSKHVWQFSLRFWLILVSGSPNIRVVSKQCLCSLGFR